LDFCFFRSLYFDFDFSYAMILAWWVGQMLSNPQSFLSADFADFLRRYHGWSPESIRVGPLPISCALSGHSVGGFRRRSEAMAEKLPAVVDMDGHGLSRTDTDGFGAVAPAFDRELTRNLGQSGGQHG
jgi:hypothetical protein